MTIKEYIMKNLPNFNWNILPQIFEENGVEMNEEIEAYLRNTPENTNWSILEQLGENESEIELPAKLVCIDGYYQNNLPSGSSWDTTAEAWEWINQNSINIDGRTYIEGTKLHLVDSNGNYFDDFTETKNGWIQVDVCSWSTRNYTINLRENSFFIEYQD